MFLTLLAENVSCVQGTFKVVSIRRRDKQKATNSVYLVGYSGCIRSPMAVQKQKPSVY